MADIAVDEGCRLVLENEASSWAGTGREAAWIIQEVGPEKLGLCWDPGNSARAGTGSPFPDDYEEVKQFVIHVHVKNYNPDTGGWSLAKTGAVDWSGQLAALRTDGYAGHIVIETHTDISPHKFEPLDNGLSDLERNTRQNLEYVRDRLKA